MAMQMDVMKVLLLKAFPFLLMGVVPMVQLAYLADEYLRGFLVVFVFWVLLFVLFADEFRKEFQFSIAYVELKEIYVF
jgi:hypothetical protein